MNFNSKKKLMFASLSGSPPQNATHSKRESNNKTAAESGAIFRSVSMGVSEPPALFARSLDTSNVALRKSHSSPLTDVRPSPPKPSSLVDVPTPTPLLSKASTGPQWTWTLTLKQIKSVPYFHPMERTAITVNDIPVDKITARISTFLKQQSIPAKYEDENSRVSCMTDGLVKFVVQLWKTSSHDDEKDDDVIVEIQRRHGCCVTMQGIRHDLINAIQTGSGLEAPVKPSRSTCGLVQDMLEHSGLPPPPSYMACSTAALDLAQRLLESERLDSQRLGLESLCSLTNPAQVLLRDADAVATKILSDPDWHALLGKYFVQSPLDDDIEDKRAYSDGNSRMDYETGQFFGEMHLLALKVVSQAVESVVTSGKTIQFDFRSSFWTALLHSLFFDLTVASHRPLEASWAIRCFRYLQSVQPDVLQMVPSKQELLESLRHAHDFGRQYHRSLEVETEQFMGRLGLVY